MLTLIEARPGAGKTTALRRLAELLRRRGATLAGFLTEEIREEGSRVGFSIETFGGERGFLAHVECSGPPRVGKYGVALAEFERLALPALRVPAQAILIDELGKMELASDAFSDAVASLLDGPTPVVATVHAFRHPFTDRLKSRPDAEVIRLTRANRDRLPRLLAERRAFELDPGRQLVAQLVAAPRQDPSTIRSRQSSQANRQAAVARGSEDRSIPRVVSGIGTARGS